jgi:hypothetical protein
MEKRHLEHLAKLQSLQDSEAVMKWYGWGSPIGLSIFFLTLVAIVAIIKFVFFS